MQLNKLIDLSIVIPVYNSEKILFYLTKKIDQNINKKIINKYEIILVDDFSNDKSWNTIQKLSRKYKNIKGIKLKKNHGQHGSVFVGLKNSSGRKTIIMDDDLQHNPSYIMKIYKNWIVVMFVILNTYIENITILKYLQVILRTYI